MTTRATTPGDNLPYPTDYNDPADSPTSLHALADATQTALDKRRALLVPYSGFSRSTDDPLTADTQHNITFESTYAQPASSTPAVSHTISTWSRFVMVRSGIHTFELDVNVSHGTPGTTRMFEIGATDGTTTVSATENVVQAARLQLHLTQNWSGSFYVYVKPLGTASAAGWSMIYARLALTGV